MSRITSARKHTPPSILWTEPASSERFPIERCYEEGSVTAVWYHTRSGASQSVECAGQKIVSEKTVSSSMNIEDREMLTLMIKVRRAAMESSEPLTMRLLGSNGSYSQMAVVVSTTANLVMWDITSTVARLMTWARHLIVIRVWWKIRRA